MVDWFFLFNLVCIIYFLINPNPNSSRKKVIRQSQDRRKEESVAGALPGCHSWLTQPSCSSQSHLSRSSTTFCGLSPPTLVKNQKMPPHTVLWTRVIVLIEVPSSRMTLACAKWTKKLNRSYTTVYSGWVSQCGIQNWTQVLCISGNFEMTPTRAYQQDCLHFRALHPLR